MTEPEPPRGRVESDLGGWLRPLAAGRYVLSDAAVTGLCEVLQCLRLSPARPYLVFGFTGPAAAFVIGRRITLGASYWRGADESARLSLLAHELVHVAQYDALGPGGIARFLLRYLPEYHLRRDNYDVPDALASQPLQQVDILDRRYTLDQLAERIRDAVG